MNVVQASAQDLVEAIYLQEKCIQDSINNNLATGISPIPDRDTIGTDIENGCLFLLKDNGVTKGMMALKDEAPKDYKNITWKSQDGKPLNVHYLMLHPRWNIAGNAIELLNFAEQFAKEKEYTTLRIDALSDNELLVNTLASNHYENAGEYQSFYQKTPHVGFEKGIGF